MKVYVDLHSRLDTRVHAHPSNTRDVWIEMEVPAVGACHPTRAKPLSLGAQPERSTACGIWPAGWGRLSHL